MTNQAQATMTRPRRDAAPRPTMGKVWYLGAALIAVIGLVGGIALGVHNYRDSQRRLDSLARVSIPGTLTMQITRPTSRVLYYEGHHHRAAADLDITVTGPTGTAVHVAPYKGELVYETLDLTKGRAVATFQAATPGRYTVTVAGVDSGWLTVGGNYAHQTLPGVLTSLGIAGLSIAAGFILWLVTFVNRHPTVSRREPS